MAKQMTIIFFCTPKKMGEMHRDEGEEREKKEL